MHFHRRYDVMCKGSIDTKVMAIADRLQRSFIKPWLEIQADPPRLQAVEHLLKDSHPPLPSIGQVKTVLKHLNPRKGSLHGV